jgi:cystathionine beta-lyase/cystathionine gamma-synthase
MSVHSSSVIEQSASDISEDYDVLSYLAVDIAQKNIRAQKRLQQIHTSITPSSRRTTLELLKNLQKSYTSAQKQIEAQQNHWKHQKYDEPSIRQHAHEIRNIFESVRALTHATGGTIPASDWQSPSYDASGYQQAGRQTGNIHATQNDYKRDQHEDAFRYEQAFRSEYICSPFPYQMHVHATHSGMAAFATILGFLLGEKHITTSALVGMNVYFEVKNLLRVLLGEKYYEVDETDTHAISDAIKKWKPDAIFIDTIANTPTMAVSNIQTIQHEIERLSKKEVYLVIDNTTTSIFFQPFAFNIRPSPHIRCIVFESLNKFHQFGMDGVFGGIIYSRGGDTIKLFDYRRNMGTNISDSAAMSLPTPNKTLLTRRLKRIERNAFVLSHALSDVCQFQKTPIDHIVYPGLPNHPNHKNVHGFAGPFLTVAFRPNKQSVQFLSKTAALCLEQAKKAHIPLVAGTSFGLPITRIYQTATKTTETTPFLRISPGTEHLLGISKLSFLLADCVRTMT